jgi:hypothetical protein
MSIFDNFDLPFITKKNKRLKRSDAKVYISKLSGKRSRSFNEDNIKIKNTNNLILSLKNKIGVAQIKGNIKKIVQRYLNIIQSDINVISSYWKPREIIIYKEKEKEITCIEDLYE